MRSPKTNVVLKTALVLLARRLFRLWIDREFRPESPSKEWWILLQNIMNMNCTGYYLLESKIIKTLLAHSDDKSAWRQSKHLPGKFPACITGWRTLSSVWVNKPAGRMAFPGSGLGRKKDHGGTTRTSQLERYRQTHRRARPAVSRRVRRDGDHHPRRDCPRRSDQRSARYQNAFHRLGGLPGTCAQGPAPGLAEFPAVSG